jgi:hypothetical protein
MRFHNMNIFRALLVVPIILLLVACGGGEDGGFGLFTPPTYGAIAVNTETGSGGITANYKSQGEASSAAIMQCGLLNCKVVLEYGSNMCAALARGSNGVVFGWASDSSRSDAKSKALNQCTLNRGIGCEVKLDQCNS